MAPPAFVDQFVHTTECVEIDTLNQLLNPLIVASIGPIRTHLLAAGENLDAAFDVAHRKCRSNKAGAK